MRKLSLIIQIATVVLLSSLSCGCGSGKKDKNGAEPKETIAPFIAYCSGINYRDTSWLHNEKKIRRLMAEIVKRMKTSDSISIANGLDIFFRGIESDTISLRKAVRAGGLILNNPNSPARNEKLFILFSERLLSNDKIPEDVAFRAEEKLKKAKLNRPGMTAADFHYLDRDGNKGSLHGIKEKQTMLVFYDPECPHCPEILKKIASDTGINADIAKGRLKVIAIYTEGKMDIWNRTKKELPANWTVGYDLTGVLERELYDIPAMPTVYLLDSQKRVILKDMPW